MLEAAAAGVKKPRLFSPLASWKKVLENFFHSQLDAAEARCKVVITAFITDDLAPERLVVGDLATAEACGAHHGGSSPIGSGTPPPS